MMTFKNQNDFVIMKLVKKENVFVGIKKDDYSMALKKYSNMSNLSHVSDDIIIIGYSPLLDEKTGHYFFNGENGRDYQLNTLSNMFIPFTNK